MVDRIKDVAAGALDKLAGQGDGPLADVAGQAQGILGNDVHGEGETDAAGGIHSVVEGQVEKLTGGAPQDLGGAAGTAGDLIRKVTGG